MEKKVEIDRTGHALDVLERLDFFRKNNKHCDFIIKSGNKEAPVHRHLLSACSEYFEGMLTHDTKENRDGIVDIRDVDPECVMKCVDFMYTGEVSVSDGKQRDLIHVAHMLRLHRLYNGVAIFLESELDCQSFFSVRQIANTYGCEKLSSVCDKFALDNFREVAQYEEFKMLEKDYLSYLLASKDLQGYDALKCKALIVWINHESSRASLLYNMLKHIDFENVSLSYRRFLIDNEPSVSNSIECLKFVLKSMLDGVKVTSEDYSLALQPGIILFDTSNAKLKHLDLRSKTWRKMQAIQTLGNQTHSAVLLNGYIYTFLTNKQTFRIKLGRDNATWEKLANSSSNYGPTVVLDGLIYKTDGCASKYQLERYDPTVNQWSFLPNRQQYLFHSSLAVMQGKLLAIGGLSGSDKQSKTFVESFDPNSSSWSNVVSLHQARHSASVATLDAAVFVLGRELWELLNVPALNRQNFNSVAVNGTIYLVGGDVGSSTQTVGQFDPSAKSLTNFLNLDFNFVPRASVLLSKEAEKDS